MFSMIGLCLFGGEITTGNPELAAPANGIGVYFTARTLLMTNYHGILPCMFVLVTTSIVQMNHNGYTTGIWTFFMFMVLVYSG